MANVPSDTSENQPDFICGSNGDITTNQMVKEHGKDAAHKKQSRVNREERHGKISTAAYYRYKKRGGKHGDEIQDWLEAEEELEDQGYL